MSSSSNGRKKPASGGPTIRTLSDINSGPAGFPGSGGGGGSDSDELQEHYNGGEKRHIPDSLGRFSPS
jgi:UBX domain-containing protein 1